MNRRYTIGEEIANSISHGIGAILSILGLFILIKLCATHGTTLTMVSCIVYGITLFLMYISSTLYHSFTNENLKSLFKTLDHCAISLLIAGTYTPFTLITLKGATGYSLFAIIWIFAIFTVVLNAIDVKKYNKLSLFCYIGMGWLVVFTIKPLIANLDSNGLILLVLGGLSYTIGVFFYVAKSKKYAHSIWHIFVLAGSVFHFLAIALYVIK